MSTSRGAAGAFAALLVALLATGDVAAQSLQDELARLLVTHPQIRGGQSQIRAADAGIKEADAAFLPKVALRGDAGYEYSDTPGRRALDKDPLSGTTETLTLSVTENLFDGFLSSSLREVAKTTRSIADLALEVTRQDLLFQGVSAYLDVLRQNRLLELALKSEETIRTQLALEDERVRRGSGLAVDVLQAKSRLQIAKERRVAFEGALQDAKTRYQQVFDRVPEAAGMSRPDPILHLLPPDLEGALALALDDSPVLGRSEEEVAVASERRRGAESGYFPTVDLVAEGNLEENTDGVSGARREVRVLLQLRWELFSGFATDARVTRAVEEYGASLETHYFVNRRVLEEVRLSWEALATARERADLLANAVNIAGEVFDARKRLRAAGKETVINVLDAENELNDARIRHTAAVFDTEIAAYRLLLASGQLNARALGLE